LTTSAVAAAGSWFTDLTFLAPLSRASAADTRIDPSQVRLNEDIEHLIRLIKTTPRDKCVMAFVHELERGLSYQNFLTALFLTALGQGDPHQVAQIYSAHRVSCDARIEERLLPMFWALDRVKSELDAQDNSQLLEGLKGNFPRADQALSIFQDAMGKRDPDQAERAIVVLAQTEGPRQAMSRLWEYGARTVSGTLGHHPIVVANTWRTLDAMGWQHAEPVLRYAARYLNFEPDRTYAPNLERVAARLPNLPADWALSKPDREATLQIYAVLREGRSDEACDLIVSQLESDKVKAGAAWDAVHLVAADLLFRYKTGGGPIGGMLIHAVTSTNALRFGFDCSSDDRARLLMLLQGVSAIEGAFIAPAQKDAQLRAINLLDLASEVKDDAVKLADVFSMLPIKTNKSNTYIRHSDDERTASDEACKKAFTLLQDPSQFRPFMQTARSLLCVKASLDPHDIKYPVAAFEDISSASPDWRRYLLASSVHALHGSHSVDSAPLVQAREALG